MPMVKDVESDAPGSFHRLWVNVLAFVIIIVLPAVLLYFIARFRSKLGEPGPARTSHGSAYWGTVDGAAAAGLLLPKGQVGGFMLGRFSKDVPRNLDPRLRVERHVLTCAPTRSGKGIGCVIPHLLTYPGSVFCLDLKGENAAVTAARRRQLGNQVAIIDPFGVTGQPTRSANWIDWLDLSSPECVSEAAALAEMLVVRSSNEESHWDDTAQSFLQGLLLYVASLSERSDRHPGRLREILTMPEAKLLALLERLGADTHAGYGLVARSANIMLQKADRERSGVISTAQRHTTFLDDPRIIESLRRSEVDFNKLKTEPMTVYLVMPPDKLRSQSQYVRAVVYMALRAVLRVQGRPALPVTFVLDEFAQLGRMAAVEDAVSLLAGYGALLWLLVQDLSQLEAVYPKWRTFLANTTMQAFGTQDQTTARYLSEAMGSQTWLIESSSSSSSIAPGKLSSSYSSSSSLSAHGRPLMMPDEIRRMDSSVVFVLQQGQPAYWLHRLNYLSDKETAGMGASNPMYGAVPQVAGGGILTRPST